MEKFKSFPGFLLTLECGIEEIVSKKAIGAKKNVRVALTIDGYWTTLAFAQRGAVFSLRMDSGGDRCKNEGRMRSRRGPYPKSFFSYSP
jgi:hypothetical protein